MKAYLLLLLLLVINATLAQQTGGNIAGYITSDGRAIDNAFLILTSQSTTEKHSTHSDKNGYYQFTNIHAGEGYQIKIVSMQHDTAYANNIDILLGETIRLNFVITKKVDLLQNILVKSSLPRKSNAFSVKNAPELANAKGIYGGLFQQFPTLQILQNGGLSMGQQNPRFNAIYIDGALQNDIFGLGSTGVAGSQTLAFPIQKEEIEQVQVISNDFDATIGNYTGGAINITTKAGTNNAKQKYFIDNSWGNISQQKIGLQLSGPIISNKLFYAAAIDHTAYAAYEAYDFQSYGGKVQTEKQWQLFANTVQDIYQYEIGDPHFIDNRLHKKIALRLDWLLPNNQKIVFTFRRFEYARMHSNTSTPSSIFLSSGAKKFIGTVVYGNIEYKKWWKKSSNRLLLSSYHNNDISSSGNASFPSLRILDGNGFIYAGNQPDAMQNELQQKHFFLFNRFQIEKLGNLTAVGAEIHYSRIENSFLLNHYGTYFYYSLADFLQNKRPGAYERNIYTTPTNRITYIRTALFVQHEKKLGKNIRVHAGVRIGLEKIKNPVQANDTFNTQFLPSMLATHHTPPTTVGTPVTIPVSLNPRIALTYQTPTKGLRIDIGTGLFTGTIPLAWLSGIATFNNLNAKTFNASNHTLQQLRFNPDPLAQWHPAQFGDSFATSIINLVSHELKMPKLWKTSIQVKKIIDSNWMFQTAFLFFSHVQEIGFKNIALPLPNNQLTGADKRAVYEAGANTHGFNEVYLLKNNDQSFGYGYQADIQIRKKIKRSVIDLAYVIGDAFSLNDGNYNLMANQWKLNTAVEGRNNLRRARSDFSIGSAVQIRLHHTINANKKQFGLQCEYIGSAGNLISYVYGEKSLVQDNTNSPGFDLLYIPTIDELALQHFIPIVASGLYYPAILQKELLNRFIEDDKYLRTRRGLYAERNGSRHPFKHQINASISCYLPFHLYRNKVGLNAYVQVYNLQDWLLPATKITNASLPNSIKPINFMGYMPGSFMPTYSINPSILEKHEMKSASTAGPETDRFFFIKTGINLSFY